MRRRLYAIGASTTKEGSRWTHARSVLATTSDEAERVVSAALEKRGFKPTHVCAVEIPEDDLRAAYDDLFVEKGGWK